MTRNPITCDDVRRAARQMQEWPLFVPQKDQESIFRAVANMVEARANGVDRYDPLPLPEYAIKRVRGAISRIHRVYVEREREAEKFSRDRKPVHIF